MKVPVANYRLQSKNKHLLDIFSQDYYLELGVVDVKLISKLLKGYQLSLIDFIYFPLSNEGIGKVTNKAENDVYYQVNYLVSLRQKSSTDKFFLTCSAIRYINEKSIETYAPVVLIPIEIDYHNFKISISGEPIVNQLLLHYLSKRFSKNGEKNIDTIEAFLHPKLNTLENIDRYSQSLAKKCGLKQLVYNYITVASVEYHDYVMDTNFFDSERSVYELKPNEIVKDFYSKIKSVLPTNIYQKYVLLKVDSGANFAVNGKLGSGKTYTAVNIIADQIAKKKRVLYVNQDIDNLYEMEKNLSILGISRLVYNFSKNLKQIEIPPVIFPEPQNDEFDFSVVDKLEQYGLDYETNVHGFTKKRILEQIAILQRKHPKIEKIQIEKELEYFEVKKCYQGLKKVEAALEKIDPYENNCWKNVTVFHNNITYNEIVLRTEEFEKINTQLSDDIVKFGKKYKMKLPNSINDLYMLTTSVLVFDQTKPLKLWLEPKAHLKAKIAIKELQSLSDLYYGATEYYEKNISPDYIRGTAKQILKQIYYEHLNLEDGTKDSDEIYINRMFFETNKVATMIKSIESVTTDINNGNKTLCKLFSVKNLEPYMYSALENLLAFITNNVILKNWFLIWEDSLSALMLMHDKTKIIKMELESQRKQFSRYLLKEEYANFSYADEAAKSISPHRFSKSYFNIKAIKMDRLSFDYIFKIYQQYYQKLVELNHLVVDMGQIKKYSAEYQVESFMIFCEYVKRLSKNEVRFVRAFFKEYLDKSEADKQKDIISIQQFLINCLELDELIKKLTYFKVVPSGNTSVAKANNLLDWRQYFQNIISIKKKLEKTFLDNNVINYSNILKLNSYDVQIESVLENIESDKKYYQNLIGESFIGIETDVIALSRLMEYFEQFCDRFEKIDYVDQIYDASKFKNMVEDVSELSKLYLQWYNKFKAFSICFRGGKADLQRQTLNENKKVLANFINKIYQINDVLAITEWIRNFEKYQLSDLSDGLKTGRYKKDIADRYLYSTLCKYREIIEDIPHNNYSTTEFVEHLNEYNQFERNYCTQNILELQNNQEIEKKSTFRLPHSRFNNYNHFVEITDKQKYVFLCDLNIFNTDLNLELFDLVIIDDGHLSSANKYNRIKDCKQVVVFGDKGFHSSILNILMQRIKDASVVDYNYRYIPMTTKFNNPLTNNNHYILSTKVRVMIDRIKGYDQFVKNIIDVFYDNTEQLINIVVGTEASRRMIYSKLVEYLEDFYSEQEITTIFNYKIKIINSFNEGGCYVDTVFFYYDDYKKEEEGTKELLFKNFTIVKKQIYINYIENKVEEDNELIEKEIQHIMTEAKQPKRSLGIVDNLISDLKKKFVRATPGVGMFDVIIKGAKMTGIIIKGRTNEIIYSNIHEFNYYYTEYRQFGWQVYIINIENLIDNYDQTIQEIVSYCKK